MSDKYDNLIAKNEHGNYDLKARHAIKTILETLGAHGYFQSPNQPPVYGTEKFAHLREDIDLILEHLGLETDSQELLLKPRRLIKKERRRSSHSYN